MDNSDVRAVLRQLQEIKAALVLLITVQQNRPDEIKQFGIRALAERTRRTLEEQVPTEIGSLPF